jgi:hypothetical protein
LIARFINPKFVIPPTDQPDIPNRMSADIRQPDAHLSAFSVIKHQTAVIEELSSQSLRSIFDLDVDDIIRRIYLVLSLVWRVLKSSTSRR